MRRQGEEEAVLLSPSAILPALVALHTTVTIWSGTLGHPVGASRPVQWDYAQAKETREEMTGRL